MRNVPLLLAHVAALLSLTAACSSEEPRSSCSGTPEPRSVLIASDVACGLLSSGSPYPTYARCEDLCGSPYTGCSLPDDYVQAYAALQPDAAADDGGLAAPVTCPATVSSIQLKCYVDCTGRRTEGMAVLVDARLGLSPGEYLAACAHLEAVSVHAFERLARELGAHGAPASLIAAAEQAAAEEVRHTELTAGLAARFGASVIHPRPPAATRPRSLLAIAIENAVEGCVRETYGAALALVQAERATDPDVKRALAEIARDECAHAALGWRIRAWADGALDDDGRRAVADAIRDAAAGLSFSDDRLTEATRRACGLPDAAEQARLAALVDAHVLAA